MKKGMRSAISLLMALLLSAGALTACGETTQDETTGTDSTEATESATVDNTAGTESATQTEAKTEAGSETETETEEETELYVSPDCTDSATVDLANRLANRVNVYYPNSSRQEMIMENMNMTLDYSLSLDKGQQVTALKNSKGKTFLENTMDVFVRTTKGETYLASGSSYVASTNIRRFGYYYYEARVEGQDFLNNLQVTDELKLPLKATSPKHMTEVKMVDGKMTFNTTGDDAHFQVVKTFSLSDYNYLSITMKADYTSAAVSHMIYVQTSDMSNFSQSKNIRFQFTGDGEYHEYRIPLSSFGDDSTKITALRIDFDGVFVDTAYEIAEIKLLQIDDSKALTTLGLARSFHVYSDKLHQVAQIAATEKTENIAEVGFLAKLPQANVKALVIKDKNGLHSSLDGVDQKSIEFVGFDTEAGVVGFINPTGEYEGKMTLTLTDGTYVLEHSRAPKNGTIIPSVEGTKNANDFYIGQRVYTADDHDLDAFVVEAALERNPLTSKDIVVNDGSSFAKFLGYDTLRGCYDVSLNGSPNFNIPYYQSPNRHYIADLTFTGDTSDRSIYLMASVEYGYLECAVLLDENDMLLPVPVEVAKNFSEASGGERNLYDLDDPKYSETFVPLYIGKGETKSYTMAHIYQNWGKYPLKQISSIQSITPYYHLSTGVTESNCITPYYVTSRAPFTAKNLNMLPDHRSASAPLWTDQPQHSLGGYHYFLQYTDSEGSFSAGELDKLYITSYGPTYAEVEMDYTSNDGKMKITYTHMEMPQLDENRTYYIMEYEVLEDIKFTDFRNDFSFYSMTENGTGSTYSQVGYLDVNNKSVVVNATTIGSPKSYILGDNAPYFSFFNVLNYKPSDTTGKGYINLAFLVHSSSFTIGGKESDAHFILNDRGEELFLSLDLGEVTLKKGDKFTINAILLPWGSFQSIYDGSNGKAPDQNVRDVRQNSILDPLKATAVENCTVMDSTFLPKVRSTDGKSATFTLSGGENNVTVRAYGFDMLTVPKIYELKNGEWVEYVVSSIDTPDGEGHSHPYDGYMVQYDRDGTFSYSFVTTLTGDEARTFKIVADTAFEGWPKNEEDDKADTGVYITPEDIDAGAASSAGAGAHSVMTEGDVTFARIYGNAEKTEGFILPYTATTSRESGSYIFIKYRIPTTNKESAGSFEYYVSTVNSSPVAPDRVRCAKLVKDGQWHIAVVDVSAETHASFKPDENGRYFARYLRLDYFNQKMSKDSYVDIQFFGMAVTLEDVCAYAEGFTTISLIKNGVEESFIDVATAEVLEEGAAGTGVSYIDSASGYTKSNLLYATCIDMINGVGINGEEKLYMRGGNSVAGIDVFEDKITTVNNSQLIFSGWAVVEGGAGKYLYSCDGGKTWQELALTNGLELIKDGGDAHLSAASSRVGGTSFKDKENSIKNCVFQGSVGMGDKVPGLAADLSAYKGKTISVTFAVAPASAPNTLCLIAHLSSVTVE